LKDVDSIAIGGQENDGILTNKHSSTLEKRVGRRAGQKNRYSYKQKIDENKESFKNFIRRFRNSPVTRISYTHWFRRFVAFSNLLDVRERIKIEVNDNPDLLLFEDTRKIQNHIKNFLDYQYEVLHLSPKTVRGYYDAVRHFYQSNEIVLNWHVIKDYVGASSSISANFDMPYTYEEIHKMLDKATEREKVIILLLCSTGMRRGALPLLKYGDLRWIEKYQIYEMKLYAGFKNDEYTVYCSLECTSAINSYLDFRRRYGEEITKDSYLIRKQFNTRNNRGLIKVSDASDPPQDHMTTNSNIQSIIYKLVYDSGVRNFEDKKTRLGDRHQNMLAHSFRKFFENKCLEAGVDPFYVSVLMGHKAGIGVERHYYRPNSITGENSLLELYVKKAMPYLIISEESRLRFKNRDLEIRMKEDEERFMNAFEEREKMNNEAIEELSSKLLEVMKEVAELKQKKAI
jgi:integrase